MRTQFLPWPWDSILHNFIIKWNTRVSQSWDIKWLSLGWTEDTGLIKTSCFSSFILLCFLQLVEWVHQPRCGEEVNLYLIIFFIKNDKALTPFKKCIRKNFEKFQNSSCWRSIMKKIIVILFMLLPHIEIPWNLNITMLLDGEIEHLLHCFTTPLDCTNCGLF